MGRIYFNISKKTSNELDYDSFSKFWLEILEFIINQLNLNWLMPTKSTLKIIGETQLKNRTLTNMDIGAYIPEGRQITNTLADELNWTVIAPLLFTWLTDYIKISQTSFTKFTPILKKVENNIEIQIITPQLPIQYIKQLEEGPEITDLIICHKLINLASNAEKKGVPFAISFNKLKSLWSKKTCQITGEPFDYTEGPQSLDWKTIDRWDCSKEIGYIDSNIVVCTKRINAKKGDLSLKEINSLSKFYQKKLKK